MCKRRTDRTLVVAIALIGPWACSPSSETGGAATADAGSTGVDAGRTTNDDTANNGEDPDGDEPDAGVEDVTPAETGCPADTLCLRVVPEMGRFPLSGRIVVAWGPADRAGYDPDPEFAYELTYDRDERDYQIPLDELTMPSDALWICERDCDDERECPCTSDFGVGLGGVFLIHDADENGSISLDEIGGENLIGYGWGAIAWSKEDHKSEAPEMLQPLFPRGIEQGMHPYDVVEGGNGDKDAFAPAEDGWFLELKVCVHGDSGCTVPLPRI